MATKPKHFTDANVQAIADFADDSGVRGKRFWDAELKGLQLRIGTRTMTWWYVKQRRVHGARSAIVRKLGEWPTTNVAQARQAALVIAGSVASGKVEPGKQSALRFDAALNKYIIYLKEKAAKNGKPPRWANNVERYAKTLLRPAWEKWPLADMSANPAAVADWHKKISDKKNAAGPVSANRAAQVMRATYRYAAKLDRTLPPHDPTSAVEFNSEVPREEGLAFRDFPKWRKAWERIESPIYRSYHLTALLTGVRPGELARLRWSDVKPHQRVIVIGKAKAGADISIPMSSAIARALKMARNAERVTGRRTVRCEYVFPGAAQKGHRHDLPSRGNELRHTYRTVCADLKIDDLLSHLLLGHAPEGVSQKYLVRLMLNAGPGMRDAQRRVSGKIVGLLGLPGTCA